MIHNILPLGRGLCNHSTSFPGSSRFFKMAADGEKTLAKAGSRDLQSTNGEPSAILN